MNIDQPLSPDVRPLLRDTRTPGSPVAVAGGCQCSTLRNRSGLGAYSDEFGNPRFYVTAGCPLHGGAL